MGSYLRCSHLGYCLPTKNKGGRVTYHHPSSLDCRRSRSLRPDEGMSRNSQNPCRRVVESDNEKGLPKQHHAIGLYSVVTELVHTPLLFTYLWGKQKRDRSRRGILYNTEYHRLAVKTLKLRGHTRIWRMTQIPKNHIKIAVLYILVCFRVATKTNGVCRK